MAVSEQMASSRILLPHDFENPQYAKLADLAPKTAVSVNSVLSGTFSSRLRYPDFFLRAGRFASNRLAVS